MVERRRGRGIQTRLIHDAGQDSTSVSPPVYQTSTFRHPSPEEGAKIVSEVAPSAYYTRYGNPNNKQLETLLASLEGSDAALAVASGMAAVTAAVLPNVRAGEHVVAQTAHYTATSSLFADVLPRCGVEVTRVDQTDNAAFADAIRSNTRILFTETPTNPTMGLTDLAATAEIAHEAGALAITDNTLASAYNQRPLDLGYDLVVHSATKYFGGHDDATAGVVCGARELVERSWSHALVHGPVLHPFESWLLRRSLKTYGLRMERHNANASRVARFLDEHPAVEKVHYPGLETHPQHELAKKQMGSGFGGLMTFDLSGGYEAALRLLRKSEICVPATSFGGAETLVLHIASLFLSDKTDEERRAAGIPPGLLRLSVGLEDPEDIIGDLDRSLG